MLRLFWDAAVAVVPDAPDEARVLRFGREGEMVELFEAAGFRDVLETTDRYSNTVTVPENRVDLVSPFNQPSALSKDFHHALLESILHWPAGLVRRLS